MKTDHVALINEVERNCESLRREHPGASGPLKLGKEWTAKLDQLLPGPEPRITLRTRLMMIAGVDAVYVEGTGLTWDDVRRLRGAAEREEENLSYHGRTIRGDHAWYNLADRIAVLLPPEDGHESA